MLRVISRSYFFTCDVLPLVVLLMAGSACITYGKTSPLLVISLDGFRFDYLEVARQFHHQTPTFDRLIREGVTVKSPGITNAFYTKTFPNHYSMVTGLYQEVHGIIGNEFYDPVFNETFTMKTLNQKWWNGTGDYAVVPIWVTNEQTAGDNRKSGVFYWPGSEVEGQQPHYFKPYDKTVPFDTRVDEIVSWFTDEQRPINFGLMYFNEPDQTGHIAGPQTEAVAEEIAELDGRIKYLLDKFESVNLLNDLNLIITSDHGMEAISSYLYLSDYVNKSLVYTSYGGSPVRHVIPQPGRYEDVYSQLRTIPNVTIYKKEELPDRFHYRDNRRVAPLLINADVGVKLCDTRQYCRPSGGDHGYDNALPSMHPIFIARGPAFKTNFVAEPFESVDIYPLLCHLLEMEPRLNNGSFDRIKHILAGSDTSSSSNISIVLVVVLPFVAVLLTVAIVFYCIRSRRRSAQAFRQLHDPNSMTGRR